MCVYIVVKLALYLLQVQIYEIEIGLFNRTAAALFNVGQINVRSSQWALNIALLGSTSEPVIILEQQLQNIAYTKTFHSFIN